jgi:DNA-binding response OmpR family regulator
MHALIIEDNAILAFAVEDELREMGYTSFDTVQSEDKAIAAAERRCPDLITADVRLTSGNGVSAVKTICADRSIAVVFIVGNRSDVSNYLPDAVIVPKPFTSCSLMSGVEAARAAASPLSVTAPLPSTSSSESFASEHSLER